MGIRPLVSHPISGLSCNLRRYRVPRALGCLVVPHLFVFATISESLQTSSLQPATRNSSNCSIARPDPIIRPALTSSSTTSVVSSNARRQGPPRNCVLSVQAESEPSGGHLHGAG